MTDAIDTDKISLNINFSSGLVNTPTHELTKIYSFYRALLSFILWLVFTWGLAPNVLGVYAEELYQNVAIGFSAFNTVTLFFLWRRQFRTSEEQRFALLFVDLTALIILVHASGGLGSGLGYLMVISVASASMMIRTQLSFLLAALSSIALLSQSLYSIAEDIQNSRSLFSAGLLGALLFVSAFLVRHLGIRLQESHTEALLQAQHAAHLQKLAQQVVERMHTGVVSITPSGRVELINQSAKKLLALPINLIPSTVSDIPQLQPILRLWQENNSENSNIMENIDTGIDCKVSFTYLDPNEPQDILIFIEDNRALNQQAQQMKLASLGRLTGSIAHEVRNPLGAISHASQLLQESPALDDSDNRLIHIIQHHSQRVNQIIENVLQLSRRKTSSPEVINLNEWLPTFIQEFQQTQSQPVSVDLSLSKATLITKFDPGQLKQVLTNLIDNALRYHTESSNSKSNVCLQAGRIETQGLPYIEVIDYGKGIDELHISSIFEPFFTTEETGSGLGLFICREICEANQASLTYRRKNHESSSEGSSHFRIQLAHPLRNLSS